MNLGYIYYVYRCYVYLYASYDMVITGENDKTHLDNLESVVKRLEEYGLKVNKSIELRLDFELFSEIFIKLKLSKMKVRRKQFWKKRLRSSRK